MIEETGKTPEKVIQKILNTISQELKADKLIVVKKVLQNKTVIATSV